MTENYEYYLLTDNAFEPFDGSQEAAGLDLKSAYDYIIPKRGQQLIKTDLTFKFPNGCYGRIAPRSGLALKHCIDVGAGVVDRDYTGNVCVLLINNSDSDFFVRRGDRVAQIICEMYKKPPCVRGYQIEQTERDNKGFGSTGLN